jgi:phosphate transport system permease protein
MSTYDATSNETRRRLSGRRVRAGDLILQGVAGAAALGAVVLVGLIAYKVIQGSRLSLSTFGLSFLKTTGWDPVHSQFGAANFIYGTIVTSIGALILATPVALGVALFLTELAPAWIRGPVTALVETLAAVPSVVIGLWGVLVLGPVLRDDVMPQLHSALGFIPIFGPSTTGETIFTAIVVLTIMILPIISSITRELFLGVPSELKEAALGLGVTRWEMVRGVIFPYARGGIAAAMILGLGRALGEAIAVALVIGDFNGPIHANLFTAGNTIGAWLADEFSNATSQLELSSLFYLALILLVFSLFVNTLAQVIVRRVARKQGLAR